MKIINKSRIIELATLKIVTKEWGDKGEPKKVLALHGWLDNAASFDGLIPLLGGGAHIVAVDLPGHGGSDGQGGAYHFIDWVAVVMEIVDELGWSQFSLLGHSMGAAISALSAAVMVDRVERLVMIDGLGPWSDPDEEVVSRLRKALRQEKALRQRRSRRYDSKEVMIEILGESRPGVNKQGLQALLERMIASDEEGRFYFDLDPMLKATSRIRLTEKQVITFLESIICPTLLVRPEKGWPVPQEVMERRVGAIEDLRIIKIAGHHHIHLEAPQRLADEVGRFLLLG